jgi:hypothetical protein
VGDGLQVTINEPPITSVDRILTPAPDVSPGFHPLPSWERGAQLHSVATRERRVACLSSITMSQYPSLTHRVPLSLPSPAREEGEQRKPGETSAPAPSLKERAFPAAALFYSA